MLSSEGPPPPGVDPRFDALVEAELARRRAREQERQPSKEDFDALVEAEMARQRVEMTQQQQQQPQSQPRGGRREAQAAYAAELRRQMEEKRDRDKRARASEVAASRERLSSQRALGVVPRSPSAARSRFVRDIYGETNVAGALGVSGVHRRASPESVITRPPRDDDAEASRRALALEQKRALEAQIAERKAQKAREDAERRAEEERELREAQRFEAEQRVKKESEDAKRKADEQRRFDDLLAAQQAAAARRKHTDKKRTTPRLGPTTVAAEDFLPPPRSTTDAKKKTTAEDEALDAASSQFQAAVAAEVRRLRGEQRAATRPSSRSGKTTTSLAALAKKYEQEDPNSLSFLAKSSKATLRKKATRQEEEDDEDWCEKSLAGASSFVPIGAAPFVDGWGKKEVSPIPDAWRKKDAALKDRNADDVVDRWQRTHPVRAAEKLKSVDVPSPQLTAEISLVGESHFQPTSLDTSCNNFSTPRSPPMPSSSPNTQDPPSSFQTYERRQWDRERTYVPGPIPAPPPEASPNGILDPRPAEQHFPSSSSFHHDAPSAVATMQED